MGTGIEAHAKLQESSFFSAEGEAHAELWVLPLVSSELRWERQGVVATLRAVSPGEASRRGAVEMVARRGRGRNGDRHGDCRVCTRGRGGSRGER